MRCIYMSKRAVSFLLSLLFLILLVPAPSAHADGFDMSTLRERYVILVNADMGLEIIWLGFCMT